MFLLTYSISLAGHLGAAVGYLLTKEISVRVQQSNRYIIFITYLSYLSTH